MLKWLFLWLIVTVVITFFGFWKSIAHTVIREQVIQLEQLKSSIHDFSKPFLSKEDFSEIHETHKCYKYLQEGTLNRTVYYNVYKATGQSSSFDRNSNITTLCLLTQLNEDRLENLGRLLDKWKGTVSAAVLVERNDYTKTKLKFNELLHSKKRTNVLIHLVIQEGKYYPINYLRNVAQHGSQNCSHLFQVDADMLPSENLFERLTNYNRIFSDNKRKTAIVVPAFEIKSLEDIAQLPSNKQGLMQAWNNHIILPMHAGPKTKQAHLSTNYQKWKTANIPYEITYHQGYEPYVLMPRQIVPPFIPQYAQRFGNKVSYFMELEARGFRFLVLPDVFLVHLPHKASNSVQLFKEIGMCTSMLHRALSAKIKKLKASLQ